MAFSFSGIVDSFLGGLLIGTVSRRQQFMQVLEEWWSTPAMPYLWVVIFDIPTLLSDSSMKQWGEDIGWGQWGVDKGIQQLHTKYEGAKNMAGCMFAQSITIPGESSKVEYVGPYNRGFTLGPIAYHRRQPLPLTINLLETNTSYADTIVRPWLILSDHYGMVARDDNTSIKANIMAYELAKSGNSSKDVIKRKGWLFKDCVPTRVMESSRKYDSNEQILTIETQWAFSRYQAVAEFPQTVNIRQ